MKQKKLLITMCLSAIILAGGVVFYTKTQAANPEMSFSSNTVDPEYPQLTTEKSAMNDMINSEIYKSIAESLELYKGNGITYDAELNQLYYNESPIRYFGDNIETDGSFKGAEHHSKNGVGGVITKRSSNKVIELVYLDESELVEFLNTRWEN